MLRIVEEIIHKDDLEVVEFIANNQNIELLKSTFELLDVELEHEEYIEYLTENVDDIFKEMEEYYNIQIENLYECGDSLKHKDDNKFYSIQDDLLSDEWDNIDDLEDELYIESNGYYATGIRASKKKDRSKNTYSKEELEW